MAPLRDPPRRTPLPRCNMQPATPPGDRLHDIVPFLMVLRHVAPDAFPALHAPLHFHRMPFKTCPSLRRTVFSKRSTESKFSIPLESISDSASLKLQSEGGREH
ncbi:hypothetical protein EVAR_71143_1 [Eumeta japonica]|uniref:Uncharacterized protein n=1 Tax=Eumeta variegata TaxID=151549 RepID=A0A4C2AEZ0_EUMVA|nr:hypothetical protein EVAR_71143_1 [Eumeta japonica]